jgi:hypothetical protein
VLTYKLKETPSSDMLLKEMPLSSQVQVTMESLLLSRMLSSSSRLIISPELELLALKLMSVQIWIRDSCFSNMNSMVFLEEESNTQQKTLKEEQEILTLLIYSTKRKIKLLNSKEKY